MIWLVWIFISLSLLAFNFFACDSIIRTRRELADINKTLLRAFPPPATTTAAPAPTTASSPGPGQPANPKGAK